MDREEIVREDFPTARKGWSPDAVRLHLIAVAEVFPDPQDASTPAADVTSERVHAVISAAEAAADEILAEARTAADRTLAVARTEAERIRAAARTESEQAVTAANREATGRVEQARGAVEGLIAQVGALGNQVGALGKDLASNMPGSASPPEVDPEVVDVEPLVVLDVAPEPVRQADKPSAEGPSDEDLIAQLRGGTADPEASGDAEPSAAEGSGADNGEARLVAMNMALDGATRDEIANQIESQFGELGDLDTLLDDVFQRVNR